MLRPLIIALVLIAPTGAAWADRSPPPAGEVLRLPTSDTPRSPMSDDGPPLAPRAGCGQTPDGLPATADGKVHGDVVVAAGTEGYRAGGVRLCAPLGHAGEVQVQVTSEQGRLGRFRR